MTAAVKATPYGEKTITLTRVFAAPRALVWRAWTEPKMMAQWFGPRGFTSSVPQLDVRVGGALRIVMHGPDGNDYPMKGVFTRGESAGTAGIHQYSGRQGRQSPDGR